LEADITRKVSLSDRVEPFLAGVHKDLVFIGDKPACFMGVRPMSLQGDSMAQGANVGTLRLPGLTIPLPLFAR